MISSLHLQGALDASLTFGVAHEFVARHPVQPWLFAVCGWATHAHGMCGSGNCHCMDASIQATLRRTFVLLRIALPMLSRTDVHPSDPVRAESEPVPAQDAARLAHTLRESEERLQIALEAGGMGIWEIDLATGRSSWWPGMERLHGLTAELPSPDRATYLAMIHPEDRELFSEAVQ